MCIKVISLSSCIPGGACAVSVVIKREIYNNNKQTDFFDFLITSMKSINEILKGKLIDFENKCSSIGLVKFKNFDFLNSIHDLDKKNISCIDFIRNNLVPDNENQYSLEKYPEMIMGLKEKYNRRYDRFIETIKSTNKIYFLRYCVNHKDINETDICEFFDLIKKINNNLDCRLILFTDNKFLEFPLKLLSENKFIHSFYLNNYNDNINNGLNLYNFEVIIQTFKPVTKYIKDIENNVNRNAITILTRGYEDDSKYLSLINRNKAICKNLINKQTDILMFHEGNISVNQQLYIKKQTPELKLIFINISEHAFKKENEQYKWYKPSDKSIWPIGYRHMCHFWFVDFLKFCENYEYIIRIDEDCFIDFNLDEIFLMIKYKTIIAGFDEIDDPIVTFGLNEFTLNFLKENNIENVKPKVSSGPYTNMFAVNLLRIRNNKLLLKYIEEIDKSNNIYIYRWGDLPLWGEILYYMYEPYDYLITDKIKYFHGSLVKYVNEPTENINEIVKVVYKEEINKIENDNILNKQKDVKFKQLNKQLLIQKKIIGLIKNKKPTSNRFSFSS